MMFVILLLGVVCFSLPINGNHSTYTVLNYTTNFTSMASSLTYMTLTDLESTKDYFMNAKGSKAESQIVWIGDHQAVMVKVPDDYVLHGSDIVDKVENSPSIEDSINEISIQGMKSINKPGKYFLAKLDTLVEKFIPKAIPVSPCLDISNGDGGSISFGLARSEAFGKTKEITKGFTLMFSFSRAKKNELSISQAYLTVWVGTPAKGGSVQLYVKNVKLFSGIFKTSLLSHAKGVWTIIDSKEQHIDMLDSTALLEIEPRFYEPGTVQCKDFDLNLL